MKKDSTRERISQKRLNKIIKMHELWLINANDPNGKRADFYDKDLRGRDLRGANLSYVNFDFADLSYADLSGATLFNASFEYTKVRGMIFNNTNFSNAYMHSVDF